MAQSILIVDDEKEIVSMLYCYFSKLGYTVYTATAGNAALKEVTDLKAEVSRLMKENLELKKRLEE